MPATKSSSLGHSTSISKGVENVEVWLHCHCTLCIQVQDSQVRWVERFQTLGPFCRWKTVLCNLAYCSVQSCNVAIYILSVCWSWVRPLVYFMEMRFTEEVLFVTVGSFQKDKHSSQSGMIPGSWQYKMKLQLILKSSKAYYVLSDAAMILQKYGRALRYIKLALQCHGKLLKLSPLYWHTSQYQILVCMIYLSGMQWQIIRLCV